MIYSSLDDLLQMIYIMTCLDMLQKRLTRRRTPGQAGCQAGRAAMAAVPRGVRPEGPRPVGVPAGAGRGERGAGRAEAQVPRQDGELGDRWEGDTRDATERTGLFLVKPPPSPSIYIFFFPFVIFRFLSRNEAPASYLFVRLFVRVCCLLKSLPCVFVYYSR